MVCFQKIGVFPPKWMVKIMENPTKKDDLGGKPTIFGNIHMVWIFLLRIAILSNLNTTGEKLRIPGSDHRSTDP